MKTYYLPKEEINPDTIYGGGSVVCISAEEIDRLSREWDVDLMEQMQEATRQDIRSYGTYDNLGTADTADIVAYINAFDEWDEGQYDALCELADRADISPTDFRDYDGVLNTHDLVVAVQNALGVDLGE